MAPYGSHAGIASLGRLPPSGSKSVQVGQSRSKSGQRMRTLSQVAVRLEAIEPARALVDRCLERIGDPSGEGARSFLKVYGEAARATADAIDQLRRKGATPSHFAGIPISIKDLFDVAG